MKQPDKWRETINPFSIKYKNFHLEKILGYPYAGNDVFYVSGYVNKGQEITAFLKVEKQKTADIEREVLIINKLHELNFQYEPMIIEYSLDTPKYIITKEAKGERLSNIVGEDENMLSLKYMEAYGELLAKVHSIKFDELPCKARNFVLPHEFYVENNLEYIEQYLQNVKYNETKCFIHGDCHYANILWDDEKVSCLLDYELSGYGSREYDLAWAITLRPDQKFLKTDKERETFLNSYSKIHTFSKEAFDYYMVLFGIFFYRMCKDKEYRNNLIKMINKIIDKNN